MRPPAWTLAWLSGEVSRQQGYLKDAEASFRSVLEDQTAERRERGFDFSLDYRIRNALGRTLVDLADVAYDREQTEEGDRLWGEAEKEFLRVLETDSENLAAHGNLARIYSRNENVEKADYHREMQLRYKPDDNAADVARPAARRRYPAADHAAESLVIYWLHRKGAPGLPPEAVQDETSVTVPRE